MASAPEEAARVTGLAPEQIEEIERLACRGVLPGEPTGPVEVLPGRPLKFGQELHLIGFKDTRETIDAMDKRAKSLGISRSDYLRELVHADLAKAH